MKFTEEWTKEDNNILRGLIKEGKSPSQIIDIIGYDKLRKNPNKKYVGKFSEFILNEIFFKSKKTVFNINQDLSNYYNGELNYNSTFKTESGQEYVVDFVIVKEKDGQFKKSNIFNLSFSTIENRNFSDYKKYEEDTGKGEYIELTKRLIFVIRESIKVIELNYKNIVILIGETENPQKINFYRNVIKESFDDIDEIIDESSFTNGLKAYYYVIKNNK